MWPLHIKRRKMMCFEFIDEVLTSSKSIHENNNNVWPRFCTWWSRLCWHLKSTYLTITEVLVNGKGFFLRCKIVPGSTAEMAEVQKRSRWRVLNRRPVWLMTYILKWGSFWKRADCNSYFIPLKSAKILCHLQFLKSSFLSANHQQTPIILWSNRLN